MSLFTSAFVLHWSSFFPTSPLSASNLPFFDSRLVCYPSESAMKDYLRWRQVDCHINNLYNTCFWKLVRQAQHDHADWTEKQARDQAHAEMNVSASERSAGSTHGMDAVRGWCGYYRNCCCGCGLHMCWASGSILGEGDMRRMLLTRMACWFLFVASLLSPSL